MKGLVKDLAEFRDSILYGASRAKESPVPAEPPIIFNPLKRIPWIVGFWKEKEGLKFGKREREKEEYKAERMSGVEPGADLRGPL